MEDNNLKFLIMRKDDIITYAEFSPEGNLINYSKNYENEELGPLQDHYQNNWLKLWWKERSIPIEQDNISTFLRDNGYSMPSDYLIKNLGLSLTDYYWIKPIDSNLTWKDVNLYDNDFKDDILSWGNDINRDDSINQTPHYSPNGSLQGTIEKSWIIKNKERYLLKGNHTDSSAESINEIIACKIHKLQGHNNYINYDLIHINNKPYDYGCYSKLFTSQNIELVSAWALYTNEKKMNGTSNYEHLLKMCEKFGMDKSDIRAELEYQILTDFIMSEHDRHLNNIAFLRDADTLKFKGVAPIYDSGGSMFAGKTIPKNEKELLKIETNSFIKKEVDLLKLVQNKNMIDLTKLPSATFIKEMYHKDSKMHEKDINNIAYYYERKIDICRDFQLGRDISRKNYYISTNNTQKQKLNFIVLCGIPGSGKTKYAFEMKKNTMSPYKIVSLTEERKRLYSMGINNINEAINNIYIEIQENLDKNTNVIYDASNLYSTHRQKLLNALKDYDINKELYLFDVSLDTALINCINQQTSITKDRLSQLKEDMNKNKPSFNEGWDKIIKISAPEIELTPEYEQLINEQVNKEIIINDPFSDVITKEDGFDPADDD